MIHNCIFTEASSKTKLAQGNSLRKEEDKIEALSARMQRQKEKKSYQSIFGSCGSPGIRALEAEHCFPKP